MYVLAAAHSMVHLFPRKLVLRDVTLQQVHKGNCSTGKANQFFALTSHQCIVLIARHKLRMLAHVRNNFKHLRQFGPQEF